MLRLHSFGLLQRVISLVLIFSLAIGPEFSYAQSLALPEPGKMLTVSGAFTPAILKGMVIHPEDPLKFDFLMDTGTNKPSGEALRQEAQKSIKYFLASLTVPEDDLWVNLSPYEKDRVIPDAFGKTAMGRDVLAQDYVLKQLASSLLYPENETGKHFWAKLYAEMVQKTGSTDINMNDFNRVWIVPSEAKVWEHDGKVVILNSRLKVMLETDYSAGEVPEPPLHAIHEQKGVGAIQESPVQVDGSKNILRSILIPALEKEVNEGANFARLRQVYAAMVLSAWYKVRLKESLLGKAYADKNKVTGVEFADGINKEAIYNRYIESARKGVYNYIREENDAVTGETIPRKYFSGGFIGKAVTALVLSGILTGSAAALSSDARAQALAAMPASSMVRVAAGVSDVGANASAEYLADAGKQGIQVPTAAVKIRTDAAMSIREGVLETLVIFIVMAIVIIPPIYGGKAIIGYELNRVDGRVVAVANIGLPAVPGLLQTLKNTDMNGRNRVKTALALGEIGDVRVIPGLLEALKDESSYWGQKLAVAHAAQKALEKIGAPAIPGLLGMLTYRDGPSPEKSRDVRIRAIEVLEKIGDKTVVMGLLEAAKGKDKPERAAIAEALKEIIRRSTDKAQSHQTDAAMGSMGVDSLLALLRRVALSEQKYNSYALDEPQDIINWEEAVAAAEALGKIGGQKAIAGLLKVLRDEKKGMIVRKGSLKRLGPKGVKSWLKMMTELVKKKKNRLVSNQYRKEMDRVRTMSPFSNEVFNWLMENDYFEEGDGDLGHPKELTADSMGWLKREYPQQGDHIVAVLQKVRKTVRPQVLEALRSIGNTAIAPVLLAMLKAAALSVRQEAIAALGELGSEAEIGPLLVAAEGKNADEKGSIAKALIAISERVSGEGRSAVLLQLLSGAPVEARETAARELGVSGDKKAVPELLKALQDERWSVKMEAAIALGKLGDKRGIPVLLALMPELERAVRRDIALWFSEYGDVYSYYDYGKDLLKIIEMLGHFGDERALPALLKMSQASFDSSLWPSVRFVKAAADEAIDRRISHIRDNREVLRVFLEALTNADEDVFLAAVEWIKALDQEIVVFELLKALEEKDVDRRIAAVRILERVGGKTAVLGLLKAVDGKGPAEKMVIAKALTAMEEKLTAQAKKSSADAAMGIERIASLVKKLKVSNKWARGFLVHRLARIGSPAIPGLLASLRDEDPLVREGAVAALAKIGLPAVPGLLELLKDPEAKLCVRAAAVLEKIGPAAIPGLLETLEGDNGNALYMAIKVLGEIGDTTAVPGLVAVAEKGLKDGSDRIFLLTLDVVIEALTAIGARVVAKARKDPAMEVNSMNALSEAQDQKVGGIDLDAKKLDLQIQRDGKGVALPVDKQDWSKINIQGFVPVIYSIEPVNISALLGIG